MIADYERHGRLHDGTPDDMEAAIIDAWSQARQRGESVALMANTNHTVDRLNQLAQQQAHHAGELDPNGPALDVGGQRLLVGDEVVTRRNQRTLRTDRGAWSRTGTTGRSKPSTPTAPSPSPDAPAAVRLPADYAAEDLELGYAQTSHATQGRTVDLGLLLVDGPSTAAVSTPR